MNNKWSNIENAFLSEDEISYIKYAVVTPNVASKETRQALSWRNELATKVLSGKATEKEIKTYYRLREIEGFVDIVADNMPKDMAEMSRYMQTADKKDAELAAKVVVEETFMDVEDAFDEKRIKEIFETEYEQDIEEPFIKDLIKDIMDDVKEKGKHAKLYRVLKSADFKHIDEKTFMSLSYLILKEISEAEKSGKRVAIDMRNIDKHRLALLVVSNLKELSLVVDEEKKNVTTEKCPADAVREYIEKIIRDQKKYVDEGKEVPEELLIPQEIELSPKNLDFLINSKLVDFIGAGETGNEIQFYWKKTTELPALELRAERREDGKYVLSYIREEATEEKQAFVWDKNTEDGKRGTIVVSRSKDALEDICDMER